MSSPSEVVTTSNLKETILVAAINGSLRERSYTRLALAIALEGAKKVGAQTQLIDLRNYELAFCDGRSDESTYPPGVARLQRDVRRAQGIILGTPEYHGSFTGVLKNALDLMGFDEFGGKMVGLVGVGGGSMGAVNALNALRVIGRSLHAWVIPEQVSIPNVDELFDENGNLLDRPSRQRLMQVGRQVARFAYLHHSGKAQDFLRMWEEAPDNPGGG